MNHCERGLFRLDRVSFYNTQADYESIIVNHPFTMTIANVFTKAKQVLAQAFTPTFAFNLA